MHKFKFKIDVSKASNLPAWVDVFFGDKKLIDKFPVDHVYNDEKTHQKTSIEVVEDIDPLFFYKNLMVCNHIESVGPIQIDSIKFFYKDSRNEYKDHSIVISWQTLFLVNLIDLSIQPETVVQNPYTESDLKGWVSVSDINPGTGAKWELENLKPLYPMQDKKVYPESWCI